MPPDVTASAAGREGGAGRAADRVRLGYLGPPGTFSEEAALAFAAQRASGRAELVPFRSIPDILAAVERGEVNLGVVPAENALEGTVYLTLDALVHEVDVRICGELVIPVRHLLLAPPGTGLQEIRRVASHPQALAQCRRSLQRLLPGVETMAAASTAEAARLVAEGGPGTAALATRRAAHLYGLAVLAEDLQDMEDNATRFFVVGREDAPPTGRDKTSIAFAFAVDRPGNLYHALGEFAHREINLTKLESRPTRKALGQYLFLADLEGHRQEPRIAEALAGLGRQCSFLKVLGSYPRAHP